MPSNRQVFIVADGKRHTCGDSIKKVDIHDQKYTKAGHVTAIGDHVWATGSQITNSSMKMESH